MWLPKTNIEEKLTALQSKNLNQNTILQEVNRILNKVTLHHDRVNSNIQSANSSDTNRFNFDLLETNRIYHISQIKQICIDYRLRFLDSKYFKGSIPQEAISEIRALEQVHNIEIKGFKIIAPSKLFKLEDKDDPLLFTAIGNNYFYLIHTWGNDLHPLRKSLMWPFKNIVNLGLVALVLSYLIALVIPNSLFSKSPTNAHFFVLFFFVFKSVVAVMIYYIVAKGKNFNPAIWNSKYIKL